MKISIITVCYNSEATIKETIESVLSQTYPPYEYIIIDGKSSDSTMEIISKYKKDFSTKNIKYQIISEKDKGLYDAMNKGINIATGDVIGIINSDDWYEPYVCERVKQIFNKNNKIDIVHALVRRVMTNGFTYLMAGKNISRLKYYMCLNHPTFFVKKEVYQKWGTFSLIYKTAADYDFTLRVWLKGAHFYKCNEIFSNMRLGGNSEVNYKLGLQEKQRIQLTNGINPIYAEISYGVFYIKHALINLLQKHHINYQKYLKKKI